MATKTLLITGGNTGLGLEAVRALAKSSNSYHIIIACRTPSKGEDAISTVKSEVPDTKSTFSVEQCDLESDESLEALAKTVSSKHNHLDVLINNGGANFDADLAAGKLTIRQAYNKSWDLNVAGTHVLTTLLVPSLLKSSDPRLLFVTSGTSSLTETDTKVAPYMERINQAPAAGWPKDPGPNPITAYRSSKAGLNMLVREWNRNLTNDGVKVWACSPGFLATGLAGIGKEKLLKMGALEPHIGGEFLRDVVEGKRDSEAGLIIRYNGTVQPY